MRATLVTIAQDVKIQVEFNPQTVAAYRLIGYENRLLAAEDFQDDTKDAGEIGAGHTVTALYEVVPAGVDSGVAIAAVDPLRYQTASTPTALAGAGELLTLKIRYKRPGENESQLLTCAVRDEQHSFAAATPDFQFAAAVASFGMLLRASQHKDDASFDAVLEIAAAGAAGDQSGYRDEFVALVRQARELSR